MTSNDWIQLVLYFAVLALLAKPLGWYMARVYQGEPCCGMDRALGLAGARHLPHCWRESQGGNGVAQVRGGRAAV